MTNKQIIKRMNVENIVKHLDKKMVIITGPRQCGKTWLSKYIGDNYFNGDYIYLNYDNFEQRNIIRQQNWPKDKLLIIFDELHKMKDWKNFLKGVYDSYGNDQKILITGSASLEAYTGIGDSLAGRVYKHRLLPFNIFEIHQSENISLKEIEEKLLTRGGFAESYLSESDSEAKIWQNNYINSIVKEDTLTISTIQNLNEMSNLIKILAENIGSNISISNIANDLDISPNTVKKYITILEQLYIIFKVHPFSQNFSNSIRKEYKIYFYDPTFATTKGALYENFIATQLLSYCLMSQDTQGEIKELQYFRTKDKREIDFIIVNQNILKTKTKIENIIEVKVSKNTIPIQLSNFAKKLGIKADLIVKDSEYLLENEYVKINLGREYCFKLLQKISI